MAKQQSVVTSNIGRVFIQEAKGLLSCCPEYVGCVGMSGLSQDRDENITIKCLSKDKPGEYVLIDKIAGQLNEITFDLTSHLGLHGQSILRQYFQTNCDSTLHVHFGVCSNPQDFRDFDKAVVFENVMLNSYSTSDLITIDSGSVAVVDETVSAEAYTMYEYFPNKGYSLVSTIEETRPIRLHAMGGHDCGGVCVFCSDCTQRSCEGDFHAIPLDGGVKYSFDLNNIIYTIGQNGVLMSWDYDMIINNTLVCNTAGSICLDTDNDEFVTTGAYNYDSGMLAIGTTLGNVIFYNMKTNKELIQFTEPSGAEVTHMTANEHGYLVAFDNNNIYYTEDGEFWDGPSTASNGDVSALLLYSEVSWQVATENGLMSYTNDAGGSYTIKAYPKADNQYIKQFAQSNSSIISAINDTYLYQTYDAGCNWQAIDLSKYFSQLFSIVVCKANPFVLYISGLSTDGTETHIIEMNFGA